MKQPQNITSSILLGLFTVLAILSPILNSNLWATAALLPLLLRVVLLKNLKQQSIYIFFILFSTILLQALGGALSNINYSLRLLITVLALIHLTQNERDFFLKISFYSIGLICAQLLTTSSTVSDVNLLAGERVLEWDIWGGHIQANIVGLYAAIGLILASLVRANTLVKLIMTTLLVTILFKSGSRSAMIFLVIYYGPVAISNRKNFAIVLIPAISLLLITLLIGYNFGQYADNRFLSTDDSGRFMFYYQSLELFAKNSYLPVDDSVLESRRIILDSLYLSSLIRFGPILMLAIISLIIRALSKYDPNNPSSRLLLAVAILGFPESAILGNTLLLALTIIMYTTTNKSTPKAITKYKTTFA